MSRIRIRTIARKLPRGRRRSTGIDRGGLDRVHASHDARWTSRQF